MGVVFGVFSSAEDFPPPLPPSLLPSPARPGASWETRLVVSCSFSAAGTVSDFLQMRQGCHCGQVLPRRPMLLLLI